MKPTRTYDLLREHLHHPANNHIHEWFHLSIQILGCRRIGPAEEQNDAITFRAGGGGVWTNYQSTIIIEAPDEATALVLDKLYEGYAFQVPPLLTAWRERRAAEKAAAEQAIAAKAAKKAAREAKRNAPPEEPKPKAERCPLTAELVGGDA
jgi:hypothetical protein